MEKDIRKSMICVCTYQHYKDRIWVGAGLNLSSFEDVETFYLECLIKTNTDSRFRFYDWHNIPNHFVTSKRVAPCIFDLIISMNNLPEEEQEAFNLFLYNYRLNPFELSAKQIIEHFNESYEGQYSTKLDFAKEYAEEQLAITVGNFPEFNFSAYSNNLFASRYVMLKDYVYLSTYLF